jgi:hypothetical protein
MSKLPRESQLQSQGHQLNRTTDQPCLRSAKEEEIYLSAKVKLQML